MSNGTEVALGVVVVEWNHANNRVATLWIG
jgi:hypothetical protein